MLIIVFLYSCASVVFVEIYLHLSCVCFGWKWKLENILHRHVCLGAHV